MNAPKPLQAAPIPPPPPDQRVSRDARFAGEGDKKGRYDLPSSLDSASPVGYRARLPLTRAEGDAALSLLALERPSKLVAGASPTEGELFEECSLGVLRARQSTNFRGQRQVTVGPQDAARVADLLRGMKHLEAPVLDGAGYAHLVLSRPYRTPFTLLLTFIGHKPLVSLLTVPQRAWRKRLHHADDIPTIGYLPDLHLGILAEELERAALLASGGARRANVIQGPFTNGARRAENAVGIAALEEMAGLTPAERSEGWHLAAVAQVGTVSDPSPIDPALCRKIAANLLAFRSERIQPGVNAEEAAPPQYQARQDMDIPPELTIMAGRAAYNAFSHWTGCDREAGKALLLLDRIDVLTPGGKERLREIRRELDEITTKVIANIPWWADLPLLRALSRNAARGRKAFALAGQRIYVGGLSRKDVAAAGLEWNLAVRAVGAAAARSALLCELMGCVDLPPGCDLLAGICLMAGPVNQNDIGKSFYGYPDLLARRYDDPTSLLVWTLKAKTVADPIGNEEQLLNAARKGALVDLRPGPHEVVSVRMGGKNHPMRQREGRVNGERAFADQGNFVTDPEGREIPGNRGSPWPKAWREERLWT